LSKPHRFQSLDLLATLVAVVRGDGSVLFANAALEDAMGMSRRAIEGMKLPDCFTEPTALQNALEGADSNEFAALRYDAWLRRLNHEALPVHVIVAQTENRGEIVVELLPLEQQARQDREERLIDQAQANKELIRNLAHEIKNPLGGIRGAAQLLRWKSTPGSPNTRRSSSTRPTACKRWWTACWRPHRARTWWAMSTSTRSASACAR
jgi:two-component system nitrogen regulation sensor histidine kinase GlnL